MKKYFLTVLVIMFYSVIYGQMPAAGSAVQVISGADELLSGHMNLIKGKRLGIVTNHSALLSNGVHIVDSLFHRSDVKISALFGPEHGIRGDAPAGAHIDNSKDFKTGLPAYSLYGSISKPTKEMLKDVDVLIYDIFDVGVKFYTFESTLYYTIQAAAENNLPVIVLDRPNPISGVKVGGPVNKPEFFSFVGIAATPVMHGLTVGELAEMFNGSGWLGKGLKANLSVVKMKGWNRDLYYDETNLAWVRPSPNIPDLETAIVYPGTCLVEGTNMSEGRGTLAPFLTIGAPYINSKDLIDKLKTMNIKGAEFEAIDFTPVDIPNMASKPKYQNQLCHGIKIKVTDRPSFEPVDFGVKLVSAAAKIYPAEFKFREASFDRLIGDKSIRTKISAGLPPEEIIASWKPELKDFMNFRKSFILY